MIWKTACCKEPLFPICPPLRGLTLSRALSLTNPILSDLDIMTLLSRILTSWDRLLSPLRLGVWPWANLLKSLSFSFPIHQVGIIIKPILKGCGKTKYKKRLSYSICHTVSTQYITVTITTIVDVISVSFSPCKQGLQYSLISSESCWPWILCSLMSVFIYEKLSWFVHP